MILEFSMFQLVCAGLLFAWSGFVRTGLGFGGASLSLPLMLLIYDQPIYWIPIIGIHLLFFSILTLRTRLDNVDWTYLKSSSKLIVPGAIAGVLGLINLPNEFLLFLIYAITMFYAILWILNKAIKSENIWVERGLLFFGGYISGATLNGASLIIAVFIRNVEIFRLRSTLFIVWIVIVSIKMGTLLAYSIPLNFIDALYLLPVAAVGHVLGMKAHDYIINQQGSFIRVIGGCLLLVCIIGLWKLL